MGAIQFQVIMDDGNVKEITTQAYWIPEMKCRLFSPQSFFEDNRGDSTEDYKFMVGRGSCCFKLGEGLDNQLTLHMDPNTKLHQFKAFNSFLSVENSWALQAWVEDDGNRKLTLSQKLWFKLHCKLVHQGFKQNWFLARKGWLGPKAQGSLSNTIDIPHWAACILGKQARQPSGVMNSVTKCLEACHMTS